MTDTTADRRGDRRKNPDRRMPGLPEIARGFARLVVIGMVVQLFVIGYVFATEYNGRKVAIEAAREGCERDKLDRTVNASAWRSAEKSRRAAGDTKIADKYKSIADGMYARASIDCHERYPDPRIFP